MAKEQRLLSPAEVAARFHVSPITVRSWANSGRLTPVLTPGGHRRFALDDVEKFAASYGKDSPNEKRLVKVLIVDDVPEVASILGAHIQHLRPSVDIIYAYSGFLAGELLHEHQPDLIFMDIMMPGIRGDEVCKHLKSQKRFCDIPIIAMTGYPSVENIEAMTKAGAFHVLLKPFDIDMLIHLLHELLPQSSS